MKEEKGVVPVNLISQEEMKALTEMMRGEMDRKFVKCLIVAGLDTRQALRCVQVWNAEWDGEKHGD